VTVVKTPAATIDSGSTEHEA